MGGKRAGAGRKPGPSKRTKALADEIKARVKNTAGKLPLDIMLEAIGIAYKQGGAIEAFALCEKAAPYLHPKLSTVEANVKGELVVEVVRFTGV